MQRFMKGNRFQVLVLGLVFVMMFTFAVGCSSAKDEKPAENQGTTDTTNQPAATEELTVGLSISTLSNPFFVTLQDGAQAAADNAGIKLEVRDAKDDPAKQVADIEDLVQKGVDVIIVNPTDGAAVVAGIEAANNANIPVITVDRGAEGGTVVTHIASDNVAGGKMAGEFILQQLNNQGKVVELEGIAGTSAARDRGEGFNQAIQDVAGIEVVSRQPADFDRSKGMSVMENLLQSNSDIQAVFAHNDEMALGAVEAIAAAGLEGIIVVGFDATDDAVQAVQDGKMAATVAQKPDLMGQIAVETAQKVANGEAVDAQLPVELELVTK